MVQHSTLNLAVWHDPRSPYAYPLADERLAVRLRTARDDRRRPTVVWSDRFGWNQPDASAPMRWLCDDEHFRYWQAFITLSEGRVRYTFRLDQPPDGSEPAPEWVAGTGISTLPPGATWPDAYFHWPYQHRERLLCVPDWLRDAVCYEIFPERFARGVPPVAPQHHDTWSGTPAHNAVWGGDLVGIADHVDYVAALGVNMLWLTPIFAAPSNHKYDTTEYSRIDPHFGDDATFANLVQTYRARGIRIVLDAVFNHAGPQFAPWLDVLAHGMQSPYWSWFDIQGERANPQVRNYRTFAHVAGMPRLRTDHPEVQAYLIERASRWMRMGIGGWRLDVADEVDTTFWRAFRREMRVIVPDAYFVGEIAYNAARWLEGDQFDGVMNYPLRQAMLQFFSGSSEAPGAPPPETRLDASGFLAALGRVRSWHPGWAATAALNPLSTHDVPRWLTAMGGDRARWRLGMTFLLTYEGIPQLYYGDEVGLTGGHDPDNRRPMLWDPALQDVDMLTLTQRLVHMRHEWPALRASGLRPLVTGNVHVVAYLRGADGTEEVATAACPPDAVALVVLNSGDAPATVDLSLAPSHDEMLALGTLMWPAAATHALDLLTDTRHALDAALHVQLALPPLGAVVLVPQP